MDPESSPFSPEAPVPIEFFVGRIAEIERLRGMLGASARGRFRISFVGGERGIGKSSLANFVRHLGEFKEDVIGCHVHLGGVKELHDMLQLTFNSLIKQSINQPWHSRLMEFFGDRVSTVGLFGVTLKLDLSSGEIESLKRNFAASIRQLIEQAGKKAVLLILDDINGLATSEVFANWLKSFVDEIATSRQETNVCMVVVGLDERRRELVARQPSLARVFELVDIAPWSDKEASEFFQKTFQSAHASISESDVRVLTSFAGGLPVLAHELGNAVWRTANTTKIGKRDVIDGVVLAADVIGRKFLDPQIVKAIYSQRYRSILRKIATDKPFETSFRRAELLVRLTDPERRVLDNFLRRMKRLGAVEVDSGIKGGYRFPNRLHALYFWMISQRLGRGKNNVS